MNIYERAAETVLRLLVQFGTPIEIRRTESTFDTITGISSISNTQTFTPSGVFLKRSSELLKEFSSAEDADIFILIDASVKPKHTDKIAIDGGECAIISIVEVKPTDVPIAYKLMVRK